MQERINKGNLALAMLNAGIDSSKQLVKLSGVSVNTLSRLNNGGAAKIATVRRLADALNVNPADLIELEV